MFTLAFSSLCIGATSQRLCGSASSIITFTSLLRQREIHCAHFSTRLILWLWSGRQVWLFAFSWRGTRGWVTTTRGSPSSASLEGLFQGDGEESLDLPAQAVALATRTQISRRKRNETKMKHISYCHRFAASHWLSASSKVQLNLNPISHVYSV